MWPGLIQPYPCGRPSTYTPLSLPRSMMNADPSRSWTYACHQLTSLSLRMMSARSHRPIMANGLASGASSKCALSGGLDARSMRPGVRQALKNAWEENLIMGHLLRYLSCLTERNRLRLQGTIPCASEITVGPACEHEQGPEHLA